jgi:DNA-binding MarR family transcriptional regulator
MRALPVNAEQIASLDRVMHEPARLSVAACLYVVQDADFVFLQSQTGMTGGNLSSHIKRLEAAGYVSVKKEFVDSRPRTVLMLTNEGRAAFEGYVRTMKEILGAIG